MDWIGETWRRLRALLRRKQLGADLEEEMRLHIELRAQQQIEAGMDPDDTGYAAQRRFGNMLLLKELSREVWGWRSLEVLLQDLRYGVRMLANSPGFSSVAIATLALGIGANTTIFSVVNAVLFRALPIKDVDRVVAIREVNLKNHDRLRDPRLSSVLELQRRSKSFEQVETAVPYGEEGKLKALDRTDVVRIQFVSRDLLSLLGLKPALGRGFRAEDEPDNVSNTILLSHGYWQRRFGGDPSIVGRTVTLSDNVTTVIGVLPPDIWVFPWLRDAEIWASVSLTHNKLTPETRWFTAFARLKLGVSFEQAQAEMDVFGRRLAQDEPHVNRDWGMSVQSLRQFYFRGWRKPFYLMLGAVGFVLLISCANVANLLLGRALVREREIALRASLGASRLRLVRQLLTESVLLAVLGGILGVALTLVGVRIFVAFAPAWFPRAQEIGIDGTVLGFTLVLSIITGLLFGLAPSLHVSTPNLNEVLKEAGSRSGGPSRQMGRSLLVISEVSLTLILLVGAGLMVNSFLRLVQVNPGFNTRKLLMANIRLSGDKHVKILENDMKRVTLLVDTFYQEVSDRLEKAPGVESVTLQGDGECTIKILGQPDPPSGEHREAMFTEVDPAFVRTVQVPLLEGRNLTAQDNENSPWVALVNEAMVRRYFAGKDALGKLFSVTFGDLSGRSVTEDRPREIVGVIGDMRHHGLDEDAPPAVYVPDRQHIWVYPGGTSQIHLSKILFIRTASNPLGLAETVRRIVGSVDKDETVSNITTVEQAYSDSLAPWLFFMRLFAVFSTLAISLAVVGIYGVTSYTVSRRTHEIGVRLALGAGKRHVMALVLRQGLKLTLIGIAVGTAGAFGLMRLIANMLFGVTPTDPVTFVVMAVLLAGVSLAACYFPARRATRLDPMAALRHE
jgi:putative ABC transport system permease protein